MVKTDLLCTNAKCKHHDQGVCVIRVPYYPGEKVDYCIFYKAGSDTRGKRRRGNVAKIYFPVSPGPGKEMLVVRIMVASRG